jgi:AcrR family transcriptional regulator
MAERLTTRKKQALEMRTHIQAVALDLFDREGFESVSMEEIAQAAGCSVGNIYHYFKGKDELALQVTSHVDAAYRELEAAYRADGARTAAEKLLDFVGRALEISAAEDVLYKSFIHALKYPEQGTLRTKKDREYFRLLRYLVTSCQAEGSIRGDADPDELVQELVALHRGMLFQWKVCEGQFDLQQSGRLMAENLLYGLQERGEGPRR